MAFIEGADFKGYFHELTVVAYMRPTTKLGSGGSSYNASKGIQGDVNKGVTKVGAAPRVYAPELSLLFGGDAW